MKICLEFYASNFVENSNKLNNQFLSVCEGLGGRNYKSLAEAIKILKENMTGNVLLN